MIMHPGIKLRHIRVFLDIAARGNLSAAARAQGITQPALSRTLAELETLLDAQLFRRERRRLILTEAGRRRLADALPLWRAAHRDLEAATPGLRADEARAMLRALSTRVD